MNVWNGLFGVFVVVFVAAFVACPATMIFSDHRWVKALAATFFFGVIVIGAFLIGAYA